MTGSKALCCRIPNDTNSRPERLEIFDVPNFSRHLMNLGIALFFTGLVPVFPAVAAGEAGHSDWPCVQRRVPIISAATMWSDPPIKQETSNDWRNDKDMSTLVRKLALRRVSLDEASTLIEAFATPLSEAERLKRLPKVFQGLLHMVNRERAAIIDGIERYTRKQRTLADDVRVSRTELEKAIASAKDSTEREAAQQKLDWQTRIHKERERSLEYVCESPTLLEQRVFALARELQYQLP